MLMKLTPVGLNLFKAESDVLIIEGDMDANMSNPVKNITVRYLVTWLAYKCGI
jgi:hypothetical protein